MTDEFHRPDAFEVQRNQLVTQSAEAFDIINQYLVALKSAELTTEQRNQYLDTALQWNQYAQGLIVQAAALVGAATDAVSELIDQRDEIADELANVVTELVSLKEDVAYCNTDNPLVEQLENILYEGLAEEISWQQYEEHQEELAEEREEGRNDGYANAIDELIDKIERNTGMNTVTIIDLIEKLAGDGSLPSDSDIDDLIDHLNNMRTGF